MENNRDKKERLIPVVWDGGYLFKKTSEDVLRSTITEQAAAVTPCAAEAWGLRKILRPQTW